jgi:hypothetical protein
MVSTTRCSKPAVNTFFSFVCELATKFQHILYCTLEKCYTHTVQSIYIQSIAVAFVAEYIAEILGSNKVGITALQEFYKNDPLKPLCGIYSIRIRLLKVLILPRITYEE